MFKTVILTIFAYAITTLAEVEKLKMASDTQEESSVSPLVAKMVKTMGAYSEGTVELKLYWASEIARLKDLSDYG